MMKLFLAVIPFFIAGCNSGQGSIENISTDSATIAVGQQSFVEKCSGCHNFLKDGIGPRLSGITYSHHINWIKNFIRDPKKLMDSGDAEAVSLVEEYKTIMPSFADMPDEEVNALIAFIHTHKAPPKNLCRQIPAISKTRFLIRSGVQAWY